MRKNEKGAIVTYFEFNSDKLFSDIMKTFPDEVKLTSGKPAWKINQDLFYSNPAGHALYVLIGDYIVMN